MRLVTAVALLFAALCVSTIAAPPKTPVGTIAVAAGSSLTWGGAVWFDWGLNKGSWHNPYIDIVCTQVDTPDPYSDVVYGWGKYAAEQNAATPFPLDVAVPFPNQPGHCLARLYLLSYQGNFYFLDTIAFEISPE